MMRWPLTLFSLFIAVLLVTGPARAGQDGPYLDQLFRILTKAESADQARLVESQIWRTWLLAGGPAVDREMARGVGFMNSGDLQSALTSFDKVIALEPELAEGWNKRATIYYLMGDLKRSVLDIERVVVLEPRHFGAFSGLGLIYLASGKDEAALRAFERALEIHPHYGDIGNQVRQLREKIKGRKT